MRRAGDESRGDRSGQLAALEVIGRREGLPGAGALALQATVARDSSRIGGSLVVAVTMESRSRPSMPDAFRPGTKGRSEAGGSYALDGGAGPEHGPAQGKDRTEGRRPRLLDIPTNAALPVVRRTIYPYTGERTVTYLPPQARGHRGTSAMLRATWGIVREAHSVDPAPGARARNGR